MSRNVNRIKVLAVLAVLILLLCKNLSAQVTADPNQPLLDLIARLEDQMEISSQKIVTDNYSNIREDSKNIDKNIEMLLDVFMPLLDRLKKIEKMEQTIVNKTQNLLDEFIPLTKPEVKSQKENIIKEQSGSLRETVKTNQIVQLNQKSLSDQKKNNPQEMIQKLEKVSGYLVSAIDNEKKVLMALENNQNKPALESEKKALNNIKEAIKLLSPSKDQGHKNQQRKQQNQQDKQQNQQGEQQPNPSGQNKQNQEQSNDNKKLTPEEALKLLAQLQKKADQEKKELEKKLGAQLAPQQIPVEKDW